MDATDATLASSSAELPAEARASSRLAAVAKAGALLWLLAAWPLALLKNLPHEDLPGHVAAAYVTGHLGAYPEYVATHGLRTNSALLAWLQASAHWLGYMGAARAFVIAVLAVTAFGYAFLFNALGGSKRVWLGSLFAIPFVHHWFVAMGMLNFSLSFGICLWIFGLLALQRAAWSNGRAAVIAALSALAWFAHSFPLLTVGAIALADLGYARLRDRDSLRAAWRAGFSLLPAGIIVGLGLVVAPAVGGAGAQLAGLEKTEWMGIPKLLWMGLRHYVLGASYWGVASLVPALVMLGVVIVRGRRRLAHFSAAAVAVLAAGYAFLPSFMFPIWAYFNTRFVPFLWLALFVRLPQSLPRKLVALVACAGVAGTVGNGLALLRMDADVAEFRSGLPFVDKGARLLPLLFSVKSPGDNIEPVLHAWAYYAIEHQTSADLLWASRSVDAVQYRTLPPARFHHDVIQNMPRQMATPEAWCRVLVSEAGTVPSDCSAAWSAEWRSYLADAQKRYTHVLLWDAPAAAMGIINEYFPIVHKQGRLAIGRHEPAR